MPTVDFDVTLGETYYIAVDSIDGDPAELSLNLADNSSTGDLPLPPGAVGMLDFKNGVYKWGGSPETLYAAADVIDSPGLVIPDLGLFMQGYELVSPFANNPAIQILSGDFLTHLLSGDFTAVAECYSDTWSQALFIEQAALSFGALSYGYGPNNYILYFELNGGTHELSINQSTAYGIPAHNIIAMTRESAGIATQIAYGEPSGSVYEDRTGTSPNTWSPDSAWLGGDSSGAFNTSQTLWTRIVFYPKQDDGDLGGLITEQLLEPPPNDDFADAIAIALGETLAGHNYLATKEMGEPDHAGRASRDSVWWKYTAEASGSRTVTVTPIGDFDGWGPTLGIYTGSNVASLSEVDSVWDWPGASLTFTASGGVTYYFSVAAGTNPLGSPNARGASPFTIGVSS